MFSLSQRARHINVSLILVSRPPEFLKYFVGGSGKAGARNSKLKGEGGGVQGVLYKLKADHYLFQSTAFRWFTHVYGEFIIASLGA